MNHSTSESRSPPSSVSSTDSTASAPAVAPKTSPPTNADDERVAAHLRGHEEGEQRHAKVASRREPCCIQPRRWARRSSRPPTQRDAGADADADRQLPERAEPVVVLVLRSTPSTVGGGGDAERDDRRGDAVVQPALDVQHPPHAAREPLVGDHRRAQRRVGRRQAGGDQAGQGERQGREQRARPAPCRRGSTAAARSRAAGTSAEGRGGPRPAAPWRRRRTAAAPA